MAIDKALKMDLPALAELLRSKGRKGDTILAHISPKEAALLKRRGGSGNINPDTGLPEFAEDGGFDVSSYFGGDTGGEFIPAQTDTGEPVTSFDAPSPAYDYVPATPEQINQQVTTGYQAPDISQVPGYGAALKADATQIPAATTAAFMQGEPGQLQTSQLGATPVPTSPGVQTPAGKDQSYLDKLLDPKTLAALGLTGTQLANMAGRTVAAGGLGAYGASQAAKAAGQIQQATQQQQNIAQPYQTQGQTLVRQAQSGELTPASQQAYNAAKAQLLQGVASRGGVGAQQVANQLSNVYQNLLNNQYTYGIQVSQIGDNIALGAIRTGLQLDQTLNQATTNFYTQLANLIAGGSMGGGGTTIRVGG